VQNKDVHGQKMPKNANVICESSLKVYDVVPPLRGAYQKTVWTLRSHYFWHAPKVIYTKYSKHWPSQYGHSQFEKKWQIQPQHQSTYLGGPESA
jgi:hypothetical protein